MQRFVSRNPRLRGGSLAIVASVRADARECASERASELARARPRLREIGPPPLNRHVAE